jgi:hypothetical protein
MLYGYTIQVKCSAGLVNRSVRFDVRAFNLWLATGGAAGKRVRSLERPPHIKEIAFTGFRIKAASQ